MWLIFHMGGCVEETFQGFSSMVDAVFLDHEIMVRDHDGCDSVSFSDGSSGSIVSTSSWDFSDDATSSSTLNNLSTPASTSPEVYSNGPLFELSELMAHLPIKRGLSKHYQGKSQSYTSLSNVRCIEDLAKKETTYSKKMKSCKSYGGFLDCQKSYTLKACTRTISKKATKSTLLLLQSKKSSFLCTRPPIPIQKTLNW